MLEVCLLTTPAAVWLLCVCQAYKLHQLLILRSCWVMVLANRSCWWGDDRPFGCKQTELEDLEKWYDAIGSHLHVYMALEEWHAAFGLHMQAQQRSAEVQRQA